MNNARAIAIYGRQSVDKKDSISIESQIEFCRYELKGESHRTYTDKGYSGKNTDRPKFQEMTRDIERGLISKVVVYKLDRISRSIIDFARMMELFHRHDVEFVSVTEKFDTSAPMGRAMLNICIVFAQLERETIQMRVRDSYYSRCQKGFHMSGCAPYGYRLAPTEMDGIRTKMLEPDPATSQYARLMFEMYAQPSVSFGDIARHFLDKGIYIDGKEIQRATISYILRNPVYVRADLDVYEFFKSQGTVLVNDASDFAGLNGCYLFQGKDVRENKNTNLKDQILVVAPHEGLVSSETWLACRRKLMRNTAFTGGRKAKNTWLAGKIRCGKCGTPLTGLRCGKTFYFYCRKRIDRKSCEGCGTLKVREVEASIYAQMREKMAEFQELTSGNPAKANPRLTALQVSLAQTEAEIEKLLDTLTGANKTLLTYANAKIEELDARRQGLAKEIADISAGAISPERLERVTTHLEHWDEVSFEDKRAAVDCMIASVRVTSEEMLMEWEF